MISVILIPSIDGEPVLREPAGLLSEGYGNFPGRERIFRPIFGRKLPENALEIGGERYHNLFEGADTT